MRGGEESSKAKTRRLANAMHYYKKAAKLGSSDAENALGIMIEELGDVVHVRPGVDSDGNDLSDRKTSDGPLKANADPEDVFYADATPRFLGRDPSGAQIWYRRAAFNGNPYALLNLARLYATGKGVEQQQAYACKLLKEAASKGVMQAEIELRLLQKNMFQAADSAEALISKSPHHSYEAEGRTRGLHSTEGSTTRCAGSSKIARGRRRSSDNDEARTACDHAPAQTG